MVDEEVAVGQYFHNPNNPHVYHPATISQGARNNEAAIVFLKNRLTDQQWELFKKDVFRNFAELRSPSFKNIVAHEVIFRRVRKDNIDLHQLWFEIGSKLCRFSIEEWCLITGLDCSPLPTNVTYKGKGKKRLCKFFEDCNTLGKIDSRLEEMDFGDEKFISNEDALKIALYYVVDRVLLARKSDRKPNWVFLDMVDDLSYFRCYPWGRIGWDDIYRELDTSLRTPVEKYNLFGFTAGFQIWIFEAIGAIAKRWGIRTLVDRPRMLKWWVHGPRNKIDKHSAVVEFFADKTVEWDVTQILEPTPEELVSPYFRSLTIRLPIGEWVNNHNHAINIYRDVREQPNFPLPTHSDNERRSVADLGANTDDIPVSEESEDEEAEEEETNQVDAEMNSKTYEDQLYHIMNERFNRLEYQIQTSYQALHEEIRSGRDQLMTQINAGFHEMRSMIGSVAQKVVPDVISTAQDSYPMPPSSDESLYQQQDNCDHPSSSQLNMKISREEFLSFAGCLGISKLLGLDCIEREKWNSTPKVILTSSKIAPCRSKGSKKEVSNSLDVYPGRASEMKESKGTNKGNHITWFEKTPRKSDRMKNLDSALSSPCTSLTGKESSPKTSKQKTRCDNAAVAHGYSMKRAKTSVQISTEENKVSIASVSAKLLLEKLPQNLIDAKEADNSTVPPGFSPKSNLVHAVDSSNENNLGIKDSL